MSGRMPLSDISDNRGDSTYPFDNLFKGMPVILHESRFKQKILWRVAGHCEFREHNQVGFRRLGLPNGSDDSSPIAVKIADRRIHLHHGNAKYAHDLAVIFSRQAI
jgi:hypothetical protein